MWTTVTRHCQPRHRRRENDEIVWKTIYTLFLDTSLLYTRHLFAASLWFFARVCLSVFARKTPSTIHAQCVVGTIRSRPVTIRLTYAAHGRRKRYVLFFSVKPCWPTSRVSKKFRTKDTTIYVLPAASSENGVNNTIDVEISRVHCFVREMNIYLLRYFTLHWSRLRPDTVVTFFSVHQ